MKEYVIEEQHVKALLEYLQHRPWREVHEAMALLQNLKPAEREE